MSAKLQKSLNMTKKNANFYVVEHNFTTFFESKNMLLYALQTGNCLQNDI